MDKVRVRLILLVAVLSVILGSLIGGVAAKYIWSTEFSGKVTFSAKLAESIVLLESEAIKNNDGSYTLNTAKPVSENSYTLLPGLDIPKDPYITVHRKTPIAAYLYVEVVESKDYREGILQYSLDDRWKKLDIAGKNGGQVYVYMNEGKTAPLAISNDPEDFTVNILKGQTLTVSQELKSALSSNALTFYGLMAEAAQDSAISGTVGTFDHSANVYTALVNSGTTTP